METQERIKIDWMGVSPRVTKMVMEVADKHGITPTEAIKLILAEKSAPETLPLKKETTLPNPTPTDPTPKKAA